MQNEITGSGIGHRFGARILFRKLDFELRGGTATAVTGPNGSGKSTLLKILAGLLTPTAGRVSLVSGGLAVEPGQRPLHCGFVAPYMNVYDGFTARENLEFIARARRLDNRLVKGGRAHDQITEGRLTEAPYVGSRIDRLLADVGLTERADDPVRTFSSGMVQRVRLACALLPSPPVLLLDEPGATLDEEGVALVHRVVREATEAGRIVVLATNLASEAVLCSERLEVTAQR
ncbi:MAG: ABC transporter ATP-binding protein [Rhodothermales bacterium]